MNNRDQNNLKNISDEKNEWFEHHKKERRRCVGFSYNDNKYYYAYSGAKKYEEISDIIEDILGEKYSIECDINGSFTLLPIIDDYNKDKNKNYYHFVEDEFYNHDMNWLYAFQIGKRRKYLESSNVRNWSCVERKIIGKLQENKIFSYCIYIDMPPCYFCIPVVDEAVYLKRNENDFVHYKQCFVCGPFISMYWILTQRVIE